MATQTTISEKIKVRPTSRTMLDIGAWRMALISADNGQRKKLYDLYEDILIDLTISDAIEKRIDAITNADIRFSVNNKEVNAVNDLIESETFETIITEILNAKFWGVSLIELMPDINYKIKAENIPRTHINVRKKIITREWHDTHGWDYENNPFIIKAGGNIKNYGLIYKLAPYGIYKRGNIGDWAQFAELFGQPFRVGKYNAHDQETRQKLFDALIEAGSSAVSVIPKEGDVEFLETKASGNGVLFEKFCNYCNDEILIGVLGQTMTTKSGASYAQSETHMDVQKAKHRSDKKFVLRILNEQLVPFLAARGWAVTGGLFSIAEKGESISLKDQISIDTQAARIIPIPQSYFYKKYGYPEPKGNEEVVFTPLTQPQAKKDEDFFL